MRYFLKLAYNGSKFHGWQIQKNAKTVQGEINKALTHLTGNEVYVVGAGRTDAGVHAKCMYCHFDVPAILENPGELLYKLNRYFDQGIVFYELLKVIQDAHARYSAISREYRYYVHTLKDPFKIYFSYWVRQDLNIEKMNLAAELIKRQKDFESFCAAHSQNKHYLCDIYESRWEVTNDGGYVFIIRANRFLRSMVRILVGTLIDIGLGKLTIEDLEIIFEKKDRKLASATAPPHALFLTDVQYPGEIFIDK